MFFTKSRRILAAFLVMMAFACPSFADEPLVLLPTEGEFFNTDIYDGIPEWPQYHPDGEHYGFEEDFWDGCSVYCAVERSSVKAQSSSTLSPQGKYSYGAAHLVDGKRDTVWSEGAKGHGIGQSVTITENIKLHSDEKKIDYLSLCIVNGYIRTEDTWKNNSRVKEMTLSVNGRKLCELHLNDTMKPQYFDLSSLGIQTGSGKSISFDLTIKDVYPGDKFQDTCLTGVELQFSTPSH